MAEPEGFTQRMNVPATMRDGVTLRADVFLPEQQDRFPALLTRTPYGKLRARGLLDIAEYTQAGYVVVIQDCRGTGESEGTYYPWYLDTEDGYDTVEWIAAQPWCDGNVGMFGVSNLGATQWAAASAQPPHLKAICPGITAPFLPFVENGVMQFGACLEWYLSQSTSSINKAHIPAEKKKVALDEMARLMDNLPELFRFLPLGEMPPGPLLKELGLQPFFSDWAIHMDDVAFWEKVGSPVRQDKVQVPALHFTDLYHPAAHSVLASYRTMVERGGSDLARKNQKLFLGPWSNADASGAGLRYGQDIADLHFRWFDYWLKGIQNGIMDEPRVRLFVLGENVWRDENEWPVARTRYTPYYFHSNGQANTRFGDGVLSATPPTDEPVDSFDYDPNDPVPTRTQLMLGPRAVPVQDQSDVEERRDVLVYTTEPLGQPVEVTGALLINLWASSSALDTDWTGKLVDVHPDGRAINLSHGILRARFRHSVANPELLTPGRVYQFCIDVRNTSNLFQAGHRIRIEISSSNFPLHNRNLNTGHPLGEDKDVVIAHQTIYHNQQYSSHILLPIIPR